MTIFCRIVVCCLLSLGGALAAAQADHDTSTDRKLITRVEPEYPETLRRLYIGGIVRLQVAISAKGNVENATLLGGNPILGQPAMAAVKKWKYAPGPSGTVNQIKITFDPHR